MAYDFIVLGATGMQGKIVTRDLLESGYSVLLCGRDKSRILHLLKKYKNTAFQYFEACEVKRTSNIIKKSGAKVVINCVEGDWNLCILKSCIRAGAHCIDLGSEIDMTKKQFALDALLKKKNLITITGCGSVPGIGNVMVRHAAQKFDKIDTVEVGFSWDSNMKVFVVPFSIQSIIEEFTDPAPVVESCKFVKRAPLDSIIFDHHRNIGKQKCFFVRHPETYTFYRYLKNKGIKNVRFYAGFPQHSFEKITALIELGLGSKEPINFRGVKVRPVDFLTEILKNLKMPKGYREIETLWIRVYGKKNNREKELAMDCIVPPVKGWEDAGCNIDTGMPASIIAQMIKNDVITERGSFAPEDVVPPELFFKELKKRHMTVFENRKIIN